MLNDNQSTSLLEHFFFSIRIFIVIFIEEKCLEINTFTDLSNYIIQKDTL